MQMPQVQLQAIFVIKIYPRRYERIERNQFSYTIEILRKEDEILKDLERGF